MRLRSIAPLLAAVTCLGLTAGTASAVSGSDTGTRVAKAAKGACEAKHVKRYPGTALPPYWRWGEADFSVTVCPSQDASAWALAARAETNRVGAANGHLVGSPKLRALKTDEDARTKSALYGGSLVLKVCTPYVEWPCYSTSRITSYFTVTLTKATGAVQVRPEFHTPLPLGTALYETP
ncbi:hypothetical protein GCM10009801_73830 [Streptomyces albiaxialis]|uniref:Lipoprotein n=1 Tax=Streptomyces albiaxialis TaxID=329523 RepID=A0ABN2WYM9_9ACTN